MENTNYVSPRRPQEQAVAVISAAVDNEAGIGVAMKTSAVRKSCTVLTDKTNESLTPSAMAAMAKAGNRTSLEGNPGSKQQQLPLYREASPVIQAEVVCIDVQPQPLLEAVTIPSAQLSSTLQSCDSSSPNITKFLSQWVGIDVENVGLFDEEDNDSLPDIDQSDEVSLCAELNGSLPSAATHEQDVASQSSKAENSPTITTLGAPTLTKSPPKSNVGGEENQIQSVVTHVNQMTEPACC